MADSTTITVYTREDCHLCADAIETVRGVRDSTDASVEVRLVDVDGDPDLRAEYGDRVPYVIVDGRPAFKFRVDGTELREMIG